MVVDGRSEDDSMTEERALRAQDKHGQHATPPAFGLFV